MAALGRRLLWLLAPVLVVGLSLGTAGAAQAATNCSIAANPVVCSNQLPGDPQSDWQPGVPDDPSIEGFATSMSVTAGQTESFKINTNATAYHIDILRVGWYGGDGATMIQADIKPSVSLPQKQPACDVDPTTGEVDCGNWAVSASWTVPSTAVSGVYIAHLVRDDGGGESVDGSTPGSSHIVFVVRNDSSHSDILFQTSDATWEAYNLYGGNSLYVCEVDCPAGNPGGYKGAYAVSYNRPFYIPTVDADGDEPYGQNEKTIFWAEFPMIEWLEQNGYNVSYTDEATVGADPSLLLNHKVFMSTGHDEYWSASQRAAVQAAVNAGVSLAFFSGNEIFWKTRWANSIDGSNTPDRTLITYKETHFNAVVDPDDPPTWTGTWRDPRFSPPADGGLPENELSGQLSFVDLGSGDITVPYQYSKLRMWRDTSIASLKSGQTATLAPGADMLGFEWDSDADNGFRPAGEFDLSSTTLSGTNAFINDYGTTEATGVTMTHHLTEYRASSGALVFDAGTVDWPWGLENWNGNGTNPDPNVEQATVNILADMGAQPGSLESGLVDTTASTDTTPPTSTISSPTTGMTEADGSSVTVTGTATDSGGGVVAGVEISTDGGSTWHPVTLTTPDATTVSWSYTWIAHGYPSTKLETRAVDDSGNLETPSDAITINITCPCSIWGTNVNPAAISPGVVDAGDGSSIELGVQFTSTIDSQVQGIRFYKAAANTGTHIGSLYSSTGQLLAQATFSGETASGWQSVAFSQPVPIQAGQTYVAAYYAPNGHYSSTENWFYPEPSPTGMGGSTVTSGPWSALRATGSTVNGLYSYASAPTFPTSTDAATNYWVDPILGPLTAPGQVTNVTATAAQGGASVSWSAPTTGGTPDTYTVTPYLGSTAQTATKVTGFPPATNTTVTGLTNGMSYTFTVQASNSAGTGTVSAHSNAVVPQSATPPTAPQNVTGTPASSQVALTWTAPTNNGGSAISSYTITPYIGTSAQTPIVLNNGSATSYDVTGLTNGTAYTFTVTAANGIGSGSPSSASATLTPQDTILDFNGSPLQTDTGDGSSVNLGVAFTASSSGQVTGIRFYKASTNTGTHIGSLWSATGALLAQGTFTNETASGWQTLVFASPVSITAGTTYVASYLAPNGHYSASQQGFASAVTNGPLTAVATGSFADGNGLYAYGSAAAFPTNSYHATNYWVDVLFQPSTTGSGPPAAPTGVAASPASSQAMVSWTPPVNIGGSAISSYTITPYIGSTAQTPITVNSATATSYDVTGLTNGTAYTFTVKASNNSGPGTASTASAAVTPDDTILDFTGTPLQIDSGDTTAVNVGVAFTPSQNGQITGIRFYKASTNTGTHVGSLWSSTGTLLGQGTFTGETASGWQTLIFSSPVSVTSGTTYVASYLAPNGHYTASQQGFASAVTNGPLTALANGSFANGNGLYSYGTGSVFPTNSYAATNYWVDVLFAPGAGGAPGAPTGVSAAPATSQAMVSWSAPSSSGGSSISSYTITPYIGSTAQTPVTVNSGSATSAVVTGLVNGTAYTFKVAASNGSGTGTASSASAAVTPEDTILDFTGTPLQTDSGETNSINVGVYFTSSQAGQITGIRFYKATTNTGTHVGSLWSSTGTLLAQGTFTNETASGWQTLVFSSPVTITAGTTYVASYLAPAGHYSSSQQGFASAVTNGPLTALATGSVTSGNGVYAYGTTSTFPTTSFAATNYWVDVLFAAGAGGGGGGTTPGAPTLVTASPASSQAMVSWTPPSSTGSSPLSSYTITPYIGSTAQTPVTVNSGTATSGTVTGLTNGTAYTFKVTASNGSGAGTASAASAAVTPEDTILDFNGSPTKTDSGDTSSVNLGVAFSSSQAGQITGIRFYKATTNTGTHVGSLWSATGTLLAQGTFTGETASGWQTLVFSSPVTVTAGTTYVASYLAPAGHYSSSQSGFSTAVTNGPLTALASGSLASGNGVYAYGTTSTFPSSSYNATNYWVDVLFAPGAGGGGSGAPGAPTGVSATPASSQAMVSWTAPSNTGGSAISSYTITPYIGATAQTAVTINSATATSAIVTGLTNGTAYTFKVTATNGTGPGTASTASNAATPEDTILDFNGTPTQTDSGDTSSVNLGVAFTSSAAGTITGIRFYKAVANTGTHVGSLWSATGTLLAQGTFTGETASGWQTLVFSSPVTITAGTTYVASYLAPAGHYSASQQGYATAVTNGPLTGLATGSVTSGNGVYAYGTTSTFPTSSYNATNYWVDVLFAPA